MIQQSLQVYLNGGFPLLDMQEALRPREKSDKRVADLEVLEAQVYELQFKATQLSAMVIDVLNKRY